MRAVKVGHFGDADALQVVDAPTPAPGPGAVRVRLRACGVNFADLLQRRGDYVGGPTPPFHPGLEAAGVVEAHGEGVSEPPRGARVLLLAAGGLQADAAVVPAGEVAPIPEDLDDEAAAALPVSALTAYHALTTVARTRPGETVLVHAAAGALGSAAVQIGRQLGLQVIATASSEAKRGRALELGADAALGYEDLRPARLPRLPDVVLESAGGARVPRQPAAPRAPRPLGRGRRLQRRAGRGGPDAPGVPLADGGGPPLSAIRDRPELLRGSLDRILAWARDGRLTVPVGARFPLEEVRAAHASLASRERCFVSPLVVSAPASAPRDEVARRFHEQVRRGIVARAHLGTPLVTAPGRVLPWELFRRLAAGSEWSGFATSHFTWLEDRGEPSRSVARRSDDALTVDRIGIQTPVCLHMGAALSALASPDRVRVFLTHRLNALDADGAAELGGLLEAELGAG